MMRILVVEDDRLLNDTLCYNLTAAGYTVDAALSARAAGAFLEKRDYDLIVLDVNLPDGSGFDLCREIRECRPDTAVIFLTANDMESDMLRGYELGADDYVTKPFSLPVLYAKAMALTRRVHKSAVFLEAGSLKADVEGRRVWNRGELLALPPKEYEMLLFFMQNPGRIYSREQLLIRFWGYDFDGNERVVDNHIKKLRRAIGPCGCAIQTVRKSGYRLEVEG